MRRIVILAVLVMFGAVVGAAGAAPPPGAGPPGQLLPPDQAAAAANAGVTFGSSVAKRVSPQEAAAAALEPGADVEGVAPTAASDPAAGGNSATASPDAVDATASAVCWSIQSLWTQWGTWPYQQRVTEYRYWCAYYLGGPQYYRTSSTHPGTTLCSWSNPYAERVSGGNGYTWTVVRSGASFSCPTAIPWITIHTDRWQEWSCNTWGNCAWVRAS